MSIVLHVFLSDQCSDWTSHGPLLREVEAWDSNPQAAS